MLEGPACQLLCEQFCGEKYAYTYVSRTRIQDKWEKSGDTYGLLGRFPIGVRVQAALNIV